MHSVNITNYTQNQCVLTDVLHTYIYMNIFCACVKIFHGYEQSNKANQIIIQESMKKIHMDDFLKFVCSVKVVTISQTFCRLVL